VGDCGGQSAFTVGNVADGADVYVRFPSNEFLFFCHIFLIN